MTTTEFIRAKSAIVNVCNQTELAPADLVGVLSAVLVEAKEQMCFETTAELLNLKEQLDEKEGDGDNV